MTFDSYRQIFRNLSFRRFWFGFSFSVLGDAMTRVALIWFVYEQTSSAEALGWQEDAADVRERDIVRKRWNRLRRRHLVNQRR